MVQDSDSAAEPEEPEAGSPGGGSEPLVPLWAVQVAQLCGLISFLIGATDQVPGLWLVGGIVLMIVLGIYIWDGPTAHWRVRQLVLSGLLMGGFAIVSPPWYRGALWGVMWHSIALGMLRVGFVPLYPNPG